ncbi:outer membrane beta-barrel protein [Candidatus Woesearchaeota archaeon]|nr:outer membrane beta-barrel protein [Candidatus Woesearchaeota archaeon]
MRVSKLATTLLLTSALSVAPAAQKVAAATDAEFRASAYAALNASSGAGYEAQYRPGAKISLDSYFNHVGLSLDAGLSSLRKEGAESGHTYHALAAARFYQRVHVQCPDKVPCNIDLLFNLFIEGGLDFAGYESRFPSGQLWKKDSRYPFVGAGLMDPQYDVGLRYFFPDNTENKTSGVSLQASGVIYNLKNDLAIRIFFRGTHIWFQQWNYTGSNPVQERRTGNAMSLGVGVSFRR